MATPPVVVPQACASSVTLGTFASKREFACGGSGSVLAPSYIGVSKMATGDRWSHRTRPLSILDGIRNNMNIGKRFTAEWLGTFWLVLGGCGAAVFAAAFPNVGIGLLGVSLAFGLTVVTMAYAIGPVSGCHLNPAVTVGLAVAGRFPVAEAPLYILAQLLGAICAAGTLLYLASANPGFDLMTNGLATNGYGAASPGGYGLRAVVTTETLMTAFFLIIIIGATSYRRTRAAAPLAIGLALTLIHLISIPISNTSVNPARSTGPAVLVGGVAIQQLWVFWVAPICGAILAGLLGRLLFVNEVD